MAVSTRAQAWVRGCGALELRARSPLQLTDYHLEPLHPLIAPDMEQVDKDLQRMTSETLHQESVRNLFARTGVDTLRERVRSLISAYLKRHRQPGYAQGMHLVAALLLCYMDDDTAFWCFCAMITRIFPGDYFSRPPLSMNGLLVDTDALFHLLRHAAPDLAERIGPDKLNFVTQLLAPKVLVPVFVDEVPLLMTLVIWDAFWTPAGSVAALWALLALVNLVKDRVSADTVDAVGGSTRPLSSQTAVSYLDMRSLIAAGAVDEPAAAQAAALRAALAAAAEGMPIRYIDTVRAHMRSARASTWERRSAVQTLAAASLIPFATADLAAVHSTVLRVFAFAEGGSRRSVVFFLPWLAAWSPVLATPEVLRRAHAAVDRGSARLDVRHVVCICVILAAGSLADRVYALLELFDSDNSGCVRGDDLAGLATALGEAEAAVAVEERSAPSAMVATPAYALYGLGVAAGGACARVRTLLAAAARPATGHVGLGALLDLVGSDPGMAKAICRAHATPAEVVQRLDMFEAAHDAEQAASMAGRSPGPMLAHAGCSVM